MAMNDVPQPDPMVQSFLRYIEKETEAQTTKIIKKYQDLMNGELEAVRQQIVANASIRLASYMSVQDLGKTIRIEIKKDGKNDN